MRWLKLFLFMIVVYGGFTIAGWLFPTAQEWYNQLAKPAFTPDGRIIGKVWAVLFFLIALSYTQAIQKQGTFRLPRGVWALMFINYIFNQLFSYFQFSLKDLLLATVDAAFVSLTALALILALWNISRLSSLLLLPYFAWSSFATYLAFTIFEMNPGSTLLY
ncbi:tryptophan-rich sensory protein [Halobacillus salinarum]|uniref:Tryptophan-rich sensory protein n=1 Tax=Halobacillus salinarum TaxID=2932257 RepID=A0ABY4EV92_9BACI|nr:tryptophan-rich sensory protein [Halobacillus salinarum]UOQ46076.1 tryptophan-rich sensory protein [Halobacillus salinarum]